MTELFAVIKSIYASPLDFSETFSCPGHSTVRCAAFGAKQFFG